jgi:LEA14-like dessication related protein
MTSPIKSLFLSLFLLMAGCAVDHPLPTPPQVRVWLTHIDIVKLDLPEQRYRVRLRIQNPSEYPLSAIGISLHLHLGEGHLGHGVSNQPIGLGAMSEVLVDMEIVSLDPVMAELVRWSQKPNYGSLAYEVEGRLLLSNEIPPVYYTSKGKLGQPGYDNH